MTTKESLDPGQLAEYEIVGELAGREDATMLLATRRSDHRAVLITVVREPEGDAGNALSHLAADVNLLAGASHPHVVPVLEGRWLGTDAFAIMTERSPAPTLEELLTRRDEELPFARVAAVLRDVNAALEWARDRQVVHRALRLDSVYVEPGSDDARVSFVMTALAATGTPGAEADARTVASLARAMLTRSVMDPERDAQPLAELRPGLPARVAEETNALLAEAPGTDTVPDARSYIAAIAMAEELKRAEDERASIRQQIDEEQRCIRAELAAERATLAKEREAFQRQSAKSREEIAARFAALDAEASLYAATSELPGIGPDVPDEARAAMVSGTTPLVDHALDSPIEPYDEIVDEPEVEAADTGSQERVTRAPLVRNAAVALLLLVVLVGASAIALSRRGAASRRADDRPRPTVVDSIAGSVAAPVATVDTSHLGTAAPAPEAPAPRPAVDEMSRRTRRAEPRELPAPEPPIERPTEPAPAVPAVSPADTLKLLPFTRPDSARRGTAAKARLDSLPKVVLPKLDSLLPRRDTTTGQAPG